MQHDSREFSHFHMQKSHLGFTVSNRTLFSVISLKINLIVKLKIYIDRSSRNTHFGIRKSILISSNYGDILSQSTITNGKKKGKTLNETF